MSKLIEDIRIATLGLAAGLFSSGITLLIARIDSYHRYLAWVSREDYAYQRVEGLWWVPAFCWHILISVVASLLVHRYLSSHSRSTFLLWQIVGIASLFGWVLTALCLMGLEFTFEGSLNSFVHMLTTERLSFITNCVATVFVCNVFYGSVMSASFRLYSDQRDAKLALECGDHALLPH